MLSCFSPRRYTLRWFSIALLALCAGCSFGFLALLGSIDTVRAAYLSDNAGLLLGTLIGVLALVTLLVLVWRRRSNLSRAR
jgi:nitrate reductase gamma subunit